MAARFITEKLEIHRIYTYKRYYDINNFVKKSKLY